MTFTEPRGLLLLLFLPLFAAAIRLAFRRRRTSVPSFYLLREIIDSLPVLPRSHIMRKRLQILLLLSSVVLLGTAAGGPVAGSADWQPLRVLLVLDHLSTGDSWEGLLGNTARFLLPLRSGDRVLIVRSDGQTVTEDFVSPRKAVSALRRQSPSDLPLSIDAALDSLKLLVSARRPDRVAVATSSPRRWIDGSWGRGRPSWDFITAGQPLPAVNYAILDIDVLPDLLHPGRVSLYCRAGAFTPPGIDTPGEGTITVSLDGKTVDSKDVLFGPAGTGGAVFQDLTLGEGLLAVDLEPRDPFDRDNRFLTPLRSRPFLSAALITAGNHPLESALRSIPGIALTVLSPGEGFPGPAPLVTIYDGYVPGKMEGNSLVIGPFGDLGVLTFRGEALRPSIISADGTHPLLEGVSFQSLAIGRMPILAPKPGVEVLVRADSHPLVSAWENPVGDRFAVFSADPVDTGWYRDPSFPILVANLVSWLGSEAKGARSAFRVGEQVGGAGLGGAGSIVDPLGGKHRIGKGRSRRLSLAGRYRVKGGGTGSADMFANLLNEDVSRSLVSAGDIASAPESVSLPERPFHVPLQAPFTAAAILFLLLEIFVAPPIRAGRMPE